MFGHTVNLKDNFLWKYYITGDIFLVNFFICDSDVYVYSYLLSWFRFRNVFINCFCVVLPYSIRTNLPNRFIAYYSPDVKNHFALEDEILSTPCTGTARAYGRHARIVQSSEIERTSHRLPPILKHALWRYHMDSGL